MKFLAYLALAFVVVGTAGCFTDFNKSYWIGYTVAIVMDLVYTLTKQNKD